MTGTEKESHSGIMNALLTSPYPNIVFEESDHEVVVVNLKEGVYYFLAESAAYVWMAIHSGLTGNSAADSLASVTKAPPTLVEDVEDFLLRLIELELLEINANRTSDERPFDADPGYFPEGYRKPAIETYSDLQDILLLDPVHDVDETGWPSRKLDEPE